MNNNQKLWDEATNRIESRSLKMLLQQQARVISIEEVDGITIVTVGLVEQWINAIAQKYQLIEVAVGSVLAGPVRIQLRPINAVPGLSELAFCEQTPMCYRQRR